MADLEPGVVLSPSTLAAMERLSVTVQGRDWPATLGDFTLVGPVNNQGAWRWYERHHDGSIERIKVDHQLQPIKPMSTDFSTTPPPDELVQQWMEEAHDQPPGPDVRVIATQAAQWGADQRGAVNEAELQKARDEDLKACCEWLDYNCPSVGVHHLRAARRPKTPTLKEEALEAWEIANQTWTTETHKKVATIILRAIKALPEPAAPTDEEILASVRHFYGDQTAADMGAEDDLRTARAVLARWGTPAIEPVPVSERLPGPEDCDAEGRCWVGCPAFVDDGDHGSISYNPSWELCRCTPDDTHWLPANALPTPEANS